MILKRYLNKIQKGFVSIETMMVFAIATIAGVMTMVFLLNYFDTERSKIMAENINMIRNFSEKTNFDFANLNNENYKYLPQNVVMENRGKLILMPLRKEISGYEFINTISPFKAGERIGYSLSINNLTDKECNIIAGSLAPRFFETFIINNNENPATVDDLNKLVRLTPEPTEGNIGRNKVNMPHLVELCKADSNTKQVVFRDVYKIDIASYKIQNNETIQQDLNTAGGKGVDEIYSKYLNLVKERKNELSNHLSMYNDLYKYREDRQKSLN